MIKVIIADDHPVVRRGLKQILAEEPDIAVVGEANNSQELFKQIANQSCDVVVLDITMPGRDGLEALKELRRERPKLPVLILSIHPEDQFGLRVLKAGAAGYMSKETAPDELVKAVRKVFAGGKYLSPTLAEKIAFDLDRDILKPPHETLSDREYVVMCLLASGKTVSEVSRELSLSVKTVSTHRSHILEKMKMKTNAELTHYAIKNRLVD
jgi:two-component system, NarL family, invasion response regulator UvrY